MRVTICTNWHMSDVECYSIFSSDCSLDDGDSSNGYNGYQMVIGFKSFIFLYILRYLYVIYYVSCIEYILFYYIVLFCCAVTSLLNRNINISFHSYEGNMVYSRVYVRMFPSKWSNPAICDRYSSNF